MVRKQRSKKSIQEGLKALESLEQETDSEYFRLNKIRKTEFKAEMDSAFFFSVVFDTRAERDQWLKAHKITLTEDFFVRAKDFKV